MTISDIATNHSYAFEYYRNGRLKRNFAFDSCGLFAELYYYNDTYISIKSVLSYWQGIPHGTQYYYYPQKRLHETPKVKAQGSYEMGIANGEWVFYRRNGVLRQWSFYSKGFLIQSSWYNRKGEFRGCMGCVPFGYEE